MSLGILLASLSKTVNLRADMAFTKLFSEILDSTIWQETNETRLVWITMLAMADKYGDVLSSIPGLADRAKVSLKDCEAALKCLMSPDPYSRTKDHEGRRIEEVDGGWNLLNHGKYRRKMNEEERREYNRVKQAEYRARKKKGQASNSVSKREQVSNNVNDGEQASAMSAHTEADTEAEAKKVSRAKALSSGFPDELAPVLNPLWELAPRESRNRSSRKQVLAAYRKLNPKPDPDMLHKRIVEWGNSAGWVDGFAPGLHRFLNEEIFADPPERVAIKAKSQKGSCL